MDGDLLRIGQGERQLRHVFLFNDMLIYAKSKGKVRQSASAGGGTDCARRAQKHQFCGMVMLSKGTTFVELVNPQLEPKSGVARCLCSSRTDRLAATRSAFQIIKSEQTSANIFAARSHQIRQQWLLAMRESLCV